MVTIGWSNFAKKHSRLGTGNSYTTLSDEQLVELVKKNWDKRKPGAGETTLDRKVLVPIEQTDPPSFFCPPRIPLQVGMPVKAEVVTRQDGEDPYIQTYVTPEDAKQWGFKETPAFTIDIVLYSAEALLENGGERSTSDEWEIVTILCSDGEQEPMMPLTMARNYLQLAGGTKSDYTAEEFARSIYFHSNKDLRVKEPW